MSSVSIATVLERVDQIEREVLTTPNHEVVIGRMAKAWGISRPGARKYVRQVLARWKREGLKTRDEKRDRMRAMLMEGYRTCLERKTRHYSKHAGPYEVANPDLQSAVRYAELICRLDGLLDQPETPANSEWQENGLMVLHQHFYGASGQPMPKVIDGEVVEPEAVLAEGGRSGGSEPPCAG